MIIQTKNIAKETASLLELSIKKLLKKQKLVILGVPGGRSVPKIFKLLSKKKLSWSKIHFFLVDERCVSIDDEESNFKLLKENLLDHIKIPAKNIHPFNHKTGAISYSEEFKKFENFDIILLSSGEDGHIASLYPNYSILNKSKEFIFVSNSPKPPKRRISASKKQLEKSKIAILLFSKGKEKAFEMFNDPKIVIEQCPAKLVNKVKENYVVTEV